MGIESGGVWGVEWREWKWRWGVRVEEVGSGSGGSRSGGSRSGGGGE